MGNTEKKNKNIVLRQQKILIAILVIVAVMGGFAVAKYIQETKEDVLYGSGGFYFTSDLLTEDGETYVLQKETDTIKIRLKNYEDSKRASDVDIDYMIEITDGDTKTGSIMLDEKEDEIIFEGLKAGTYQVAATSTYPYKKVLNATFIIPDSDSGIEWYVDDNEGTIPIRLIISTKDKSQTVMVKWPETVYPDNTNILLREASGNVHNITIAGNSSCTLDFIKKESNSTYTKDDFTVSVIAAEAE